MELDEILQVALASFRPTAAEVGVTLECRIDPDLPTVKGDPAKLRQVFANLISNAIKFTPRGGTATLEAGTGAGGAASVRVRDTGLGMTAEEIAVALTPFGQVDASRSRWREGTGLGLPIARALVQLHGGHLEIRSAKSHGTEVTVVLPAGADVSDMHGRQAPRDAGTGIHGTASTVMARSRWKQGNP